MINGNEPLAFSYQPLVTLLIELEKRAEKRE